MLNAIVQAGPSIAGNSIMFSEFFEFERGLKRSEKISLKYVLQGAETYQVNGRLYKVNAGSFLLIDEGSAYATRLTGNQLNRGFCIYLDAGFLQQSFYARTESDGALLDAPLNYRNVSWDIYEGLYSSCNQALNVFLSQAGNRINNSGVIEGFSEEDYMEMALRLIGSQQEVQEKIHRVKARKPSVQKELYERVSRAKNYIDGHLQSGITIDALARIAQMSAFHFLRTFKAVYKISPYQYLLTRRLDHAHHLLRTGRYAVTEVAQMLDFGDIHRFSKAFKKKYKYPPGQAIAKR
jgi:AraC family transcriptional regulator